MKQHPILFNGEMVRAILDGRKTQTRRILKPQPRSAPIKHDGIWTDSNGFKPDENDWVGPVRNDVQSIKGVKYAVGDQLWLREAFQYIEGPAGIRQKGRVLYRADMTDTDGNRWSGDQSEVKWHPSIHMPRWASRITLEVTDVRVQRLQDISEGDAVAEGIEMVGLSGLQGGGLLYKNYQRPPTKWVGGHACDGYFDSSYYKSEGEINSFYTLWNSINGPDAWGENPWVAAYTFERVM